MRRPVAIVLMAAAAAGAAAVAIGAGVWLSGDGGSGGPGSAVAQQQRKWTLEDARAFTEFPLYWVGEEYKGVRLRGVKRVQGDPPPGKTGYPQDFVAFLYDDGSCQPTPGPWMYEHDSGWSCALPLEIHIDRGCLYPPGLLGPESLNELQERRGALVFERPGKILAWTGDIKITVYSGLEGVTAAQVFDDLVALDPTGPGPGEPLPPGPAKGSITPLDNNQVFLAGGTCQ